MLPLLAASFVLIRSVATQLAQSPPIEASLAVRSESRSRSGTSSTMMLVRHRKLVHGLTVSVAPAERDEGDGY